LSLISPPSLSLLPCRSFLITPSSPHPATAIAIATTYAIEGIKKFNKMSLTPQSSAVSAQGADALQALSVSNSIGELHAVCSLMNRLPRRSAVKHSKKAVGSMMIYLRSTMNSGRSAIV
jgi:hypothetical protein